MSRRVAPLLKDVTPPWMYGQPRVPMPRIRKLVAPPESHPTRQGVLLPLPRCGSVRHRTWVNQEGRCFYCRYDTLIEKWTIDHAVPLSRGGANNSANKVGCCWTCNHAKGNQTADEFTHSAYLKNKIAMRPK